MFPAMDIPTCPFTKIVQKNMSPIIRENAFLYKVSIKSVILRFVVV